MKIRITGLPEDLSLFSDLLLHLQSMGLIQIINASRSYPNRNSIEYRGYIEMNVLESDFSGLKKVLGGKRK